MDIRYQHLNEFAAKYLTSTTRLITNNKIISNGNCFFHAFGYAYGHTNTTDKKINFPDNNLFYLNINPHTDHPNRNHIDRACLRFRIKIAEEIAKKNDGNTDIDHIMDYTKFINTKPNSPEDNPQYYDAESLCLYETSTLYNKIIFFITCTENENQIYEIQRYRIIGDNKHETCTKQNVVVLIHTGGHFETFYSYDYNDRNKYDINDNLVHFINTHLDLQKTKNKQNDQNNPFETNEDRATKYLAKQVSHGIYKDSHYNIEIDYNEIEKIPVLQAKITSTIKESKFNSTTEKEDKEFLNDDYSDLIGVNTNESEPDTELYALQIKKKIFIDDLFDLNAKYASTKNDDIKDKIQEILENLFSSSNAPKKIPSLSEPVKKRELQNNLQTQLNTQNNYNFINYDVVQKDIKRIMEYINYIANSENNKSNNLQSERKKIIYNLESLKEKYKNNNTKGIKLLIDTLLRLLGKDITTPYYKLSLSPLLFPPQPQIIKKLKEKYKDIHNDNTQKQINSLLIILGNNIPNPIHNSSIISPEPPIKSILPSQVPPILPQPVKLPSPQQPPPPPVPPYPRENRRTWKVLPKVNSIPKLIVGPPTKVNHYKRRSKIKPLKFPTIKTNAKQVSSKQYTLRKKKRNTLKFPPLNL
jgi:hypothetical protein